MLYSVLQEISALRYRIYFEEVGMAMMSLNVVPFVKTLNLGYFNLHSERNVDEIWQSHES
jgi:hypothetical protein